MAFENFKNVDNRDLRFGLIAFAVFFLMIGGFWFWIFSLSPREPKPIAQKPFSQAAAKLQFNKARQRVEELCSSLPRPEKFQFLDKEAVVESEDLELVRYGFKSARDWNEIMPTFLVWLSANGWKPLPDNQATFTKGNQKIAFSTVWGDTATFAIYCSEKNVKDGN